MEDNNKKYLEESFEHNKLHMQGDEGAHIDEMK